MIDNSETVYISSLALLKMLRHGRAGGLSFYSRVGPRADARCRCADGGYGVDVGRVH